MDNFTPIEFWKNYHLGTELSISGNFIYNSIYCFELMQIFYYEDEAFEFLYNAAVGIERLQKITLILIEHNENTNQDDFEKGLITHNHLELNNRIRKNRTVNFGKVHIKFLSLLSSFYKSIRYDKYNLNSIYNSNNSRQELILFIEENLNTKISIDFLGCTENNDSIKRFIGKVIQKICKEYFEQIKIECERLNIYTYEISPESKALKVFLGEHLDFIEERIIQKEIIKFLIQSKSSKGFLNYLDEIPPVDLSMLQTNFYINYLIDFHKKSGIREEISEYYSEISKISNRIEHLKPIGDIDINFD
ncbi:hypothetical protein [Flavobacterium sp.]|uniref:hypothetical protein n=1 Tax=Flavobacterium sp. TaxID=239 RepID=UPI00261BDBE1|nr:hypothetical protein [Flavobacterium sp.]